MATPGIFLLSTQTVSASLQDEAAQQGIQLDAVPFIRTELLESGELPAAPGIAVFTSQHAVEALPAIGPGWKVYSQEGATRRAMESRWGTGIVAGTAASGEELAGKIIESNPAGRVVFYCGDLRRQELPALLRQAGFAVEERIVYRTVLTPQRVERDYAGIAFFSPSGVESFFSANSISGATVFFAIGRTTAAAVGARTGRDAIVASKPDKEVLIHEMITHFIV
jgi:uroporphyrinogen-III synthase